MSSSLHWIGLTATSAVTLVISVGAFSRFTHGRYTPGFYAYQLDRAPDDDSTRVIPYIDTLLATAMFFPASRPYALAAGVVFQGIGIIMRVKNGKGLVPDVLLCTAAAVACWASVRGW